MEMLDDVHWIWHGRSHLKSGLEYEVGIPIKLSVNRSACKRVRRFILEGMIQTNSLKAHLHDFQQNVYNFFPGCYVIVSFKLFLHCWIKTFSLWWRLSTEGWGHLSPQPPEHHRKNKAVIIICGDPTERVHLVKLQVLDTRENSCSGSQLLCCQYIRRKHIHEGTLGPGIYKKPGEDLHEVKTGIKF